MKPSISAARRGGRIRTTSMTSNDESPAAESAKAIITMAHSLELAVIAEGVETEQQLHFLNANRCDQIQGFYFSRALSVADCTEWLVNERRLELPAPGASTEAGVLLTADIRRGLIKALGTDH